MQETVSEETQTVYKSVPETHYLDTKGLQYGTRRKKYKISYYYHESRKKTNKQEFYGM
jgi:hypothetical protein